jgi:hypothetical protein
VIGAVTLVTVNAAVNRLIASSTTAARIFDGRATTVISDGHAIDGALRRLGLRRSERDLAVRVQNGDDISEIGRPQASRQPSSGHETRSSSRGRGEPADPACRGRRWDTHPFNLDAAQRMPPMRIVINLRVIDEPTLAGSALVGIAGSSA